MSNRITEFTNVPPHWKPRITPVDLNKATGEQRAALQETPSSRGISDYVLVLAHDPETLKPRSPLFNAIMYNRGGLSRAERELGAVGASIVNHCIYCAAVHAQRYNQLTKDETVIQKVFDQGIDANLEPRVSAILRFAFKLSACPPGTSLDDIAELRELGLNDAELLDLVLSISLFGWANRLMHTLGEPVASGEE